MNKTIFNLNYKISVLIVALLGVIFGFLSNVFYVGGLIGFVLYLFRLSLFIGFYMILYFSEKKNIEFKDNLKIMVGYISISALLNFLFSVFASTNILRNLFVTFSGIICLWVILSFAIEIIHLYSNDQITSYIRNVNKKIGLTIANPVIKLFGITNG